MAEGKHVRIVPGTYEYHGYYYEANMRTEQSGSWRDKEMRQQKPTRTYSY